AAAGRGQGGAAGREEQDQTQGDPQELDQGTRGWARARARRGTRAALAAVRRGRGAERGRAPGGTGTAGWLAGGPVPRDPDHAVRAADGRAGAAREYAAGAAAGHGAWADGARADAGRRRRRLSAAGLGALPLAHPTPPGPPDPAASGRAAF